MPTLGKVNYKNSLVNFSSSIMKYYGLTSEYPTHALTDYLLSKKYRHIVLILLDGMGYKIVEDDLSNGSILKTNQIMKINSVFPPTTAAATTALLTGKAPIETGWLGWHEYLNDEDPSIILFKNKEYRGEKDFTKFKVEDVLPKDLFYNNLKRTVKAYNVGPSWSENPAESFEDALNKVKEIINKDEQNFTYVYWDDPDYTIHEYGTTSSVTKVLLRDIEDKITKFNEELPDSTLVLILADHGLIDCEPIDLSQYPDFLNTLRKPWGGESRFTQFYVKKGKDDEFKELFKKYFGEHFTLYTKKELLDSKLCGLFTPHEIVKYALGDYCAIATDEYCFVDKIDENTFKAVHAGLTKEELEIPVIMLKRKDEKEA